ncbi:hypothetical protein KW076_10520 [Micrococcus porci]|uniref:hypothetical protein n=1 Tax=Micrococcus porci TaxID=2856555 RepID=UPI001CC9360A|nr:hypothetical protein [Micrococcus porci]UBH24287.1 hypothetical protein KW076_10520 [Micrococcus porci]
MPSATDARHGPTHAPWRGTDLADDVGSATVEFLGLSLILLIPLAYLMLFVSQVQAAAFGALASADQAARVMVSGEGGNPGQAEGTIPLTLADYGFDAADAEWSVACDVGGCGTLEPGEVVDVTVAISLDPPLLPDGWVSVDIATVDSHSRARMPRF